MAKFLGLKPKGMLKKKVEEFENSRMIRRDGRIFLGNVYVDLSEDPWGVAIAYNETRSPLIFGPENAWEVKYLYHPTERAVIRINTDAGSEERLPADQFSQEESFILWALDHEKQQAVGC